MLDENKQGDVMYQLLLFIAKALVDREDAVSISMAENEGIMTLHLRVDPADIGKVIGKQGRTARSIRTIVQAASTKLHRRYCLSIEP